MNRYHMLTGKNPPVMETATLENQPPPNPRGRVTVIDRYEDRIKCITLEPSPRNSTCSRCRKLIPSETVRYKVYEKGPYSRTYLYHKKCLLPGDKKFVREFPRRDFVQESLVRIKRFLTNELEDFDPDAILTITMKLLQWLKKIYVKRGNS